MQLHSNADSCSSTLYYSLVCFYVNNYFNSSGVSFSLSLFPLIQYSAFFGKFVQSSNAPQLTLLLNLNFWICTNTLCHRHRFNVTWIKWLSTIELSMRFLYLLEFLNAHILGVPAFVCSALQIFVLVSMAQNLIQNLIHSRSVDEKLNNAIKCQ